MKHCNEARDFEGSLEEWMAEVFEIFGVNQIHFEEVSDGVSIVTIAYSFEYGQLSVGCYDGKKYGHWIGTPEDHADVQ